MEKKHLPPSGNKHDYMSLAPYHWPDPSKPDGLPYIRKDGETNPEVREYKDKEYMPKLCAMVHTLGLAYFFFRKRNLCAARFSPAPDLVPGYSNTDEPQPELCTGDQG